MKSKRCSFSRLFGNSQHGYYFHRDCRRTALLGEFKISLNEYLKELVTSPFRAVADVIAFNNKFADVASPSKYKQTWVMLTFLIPHTKKSSKLRMALQEKIKGFGRNLFLAAQATNGIGNTEKGALSNLAKLTRDGFSEVDVLLSGLTDV